MRSISSHISRPRCGVQIIVLQARVSPNSAALHSLHRTRSPRLPAALRAHGTRRACSRPEGRRVLVRPGLTPPPSSPPSTNQPSCTNLPGPSLDPRCRKPRLRPHCRRVARRGVRTHIGRHVGGRKRKRAGIGGRRRRGRRRRRCGGRRRGGRRRGGRRRGGRRRGRASSRLAQGCEPQSAGRLLLPARADRAAAGGEASRQGRAGRRRGGGRRRR